MRSFFDTNLLVYAVASDEPAKQQRAIQLIKLHRAAGTAVLSTQVLQEFVNVALRKLKLPVPLIRERLVFYSRFDLVPGSPEIMEGALALHVLHSTPFYVSVRPSHLDSGGGAKDARVHLVFRWTREHYQHCSFGAAAATQAQR